MDSIAYRELQAHEAQLLGSIDRSERIDGIYEATNGVLTCSEVQHEIVSWTTMYDAGTNYTRPAQLVDYVARLQTLMNSGGTVFGAWDKRRLVGLGSLDVSGVGGNRGVTKLDMLYVSAGYRRQGIGRMLTEMVLNLTRSLGATALYISATPTRGTVDAYLCMGAHVLEVPDPELLALEPDDIHLALSLA
jgi:GNAT superfamily N-acetyltransferase